MKTTIATLALIGAAITPAAFAGSALPITVQYDAASVQTAEGVSAIQSQVKDACASEGNGLRGLDAQRRIDHCVSVNMDQVMQKITDAQTVMLASNQ